MIKLINKMDCSSVDFFTELDDFIMTLCPRMPKDIFFQGFDGLGVYMSSLGLISITQYDDSSTVEVYHCSRKP